ncbi:periostin-like [Amphiura filiformis]|uniref:periostin-like n=1 Tax=Amphiura filiformis TaxID=82378 RepID=UPI003B20E291
MELKSVFIVSLCLVAGVKCVAAAAPTPAPNSTLQPILEVCHHVGANKFHQLIQNSSGSYLLKLLQDSAKYPGSFSAFAFTDKAFFNAPAEVQNMAGQELEWLLQYHFAMGYAGNFGSKSDYLYPSVFPSPLEESLPPQDIRINRYNIYESAKLGFHKVVTASGAQILKADVPASNGVVHLIDKVMYPIPYGSNLPEFLANAPDLSTLTYLLKNNSILANLATDPAHPLTLFAPTDTAFSRLTDAQKEKLKDKKTATHVLTYHVLNHALYHAGMYNYQKLTALSGDSILVERGVGGTSVAGKMLTYFDITVTNGVIYKLAEVMFPPGV